MLKVNVSYVGYMNRVIVSWPKMNGIKKYTVYRNDVIIAETPDDDKTEDPFKEPYLFDHAHHTELFKGGARNWLCYKDDTAAKFQSYVYKLEATEENGTILTSDNIVAKLI